MSETFSFSEERVDSALRVLENDQNLSLTTVKGAGTNTSRTADFTIAAECISVTVTDGKICINLPLNLGRECIDIPDWVPNGSAASACLSIKYKKVLGVKIPVGVKVCVYVGDVEVACVEYSL